MKSPPGAFSEWKILDTLLEDLKGYVVDNHMDIAPEDVNWGHAGSAQHLLALLNEAAVFAGIRHEK